MGKTLLFNEKTDVFPNFTQTAFCPGENLGKAQGQPW